MLRGSFRGGYFFEHEFSRMQHEWARIAWMWGAMVRRPGRLEAFVVIIRGQSAIPRTLPPLVSRPGILVPGSRSCVIRHGHDRWLAGSGKVGIRGFLGRAGFPTR